MSLYTSRCIRIGKCWELFFEDYLGALFGINANWVECSVSFSIFGNDANATSFGELVKRSAQEVHGILD